MVAPVDEFDDRSSRNQMWLARGALRALFALLATAAILWVSWRTSGMPSWPRRIIWWVVALGVLRSAQLCLRALSRAQGWDASNPAMTESVMLALGVAVGALLTTGLLSSAATHQMVLEPYEQPPVAVELTPIATQLTIAITPTSPNLAPSQPVPPITMQPAEPATTPVVVLDSAVPASTPTSSAPTSSTPASSITTFSAPTDVVFAVVTVNTPSILALPDAASAEPGGTLVVSISQHGLATPIGTGAVMFLPERDFLGAASVTYERCSAGRACTIGLISLTVG
jgi:hypothetical protein